MARVGSSRGRTAVVAALMVLLLVILAGGGYLLGRHRGDSSADRSTDSSANSSTSSSTDSVAGVSGLKPGVPTIVSLSELENIGAAQGPIYWAGDRPGTHFEVTVTTEGGIYVRYLPDNVQAGSKNRYLTVGTYEAVDGYDALAAAKKKDASVVVSRTGAVIATFHSAPDSTYFAFPKANFQVEVFSPVAGESRRLTESGAVRLVPGR